MGASSSEVLFGSTGLNTIYSPCLLTEHESETSSKGECNLLTVYLLGHTLINRPSLEVFTVLKAELFLSYSKMSDSYSKMIILKVSIKAFISTSEFALNLLTVLPILKCHISLP